jgi:7-keto-8-aminopelargonate synthetase-like enzyme
VRLHRRRLLSYTRQEAVTHLRAPTHPLCANGSCWDANGGIFETVLGEGDAVISDALNHASIIDGIRLCKAKRYIRASKRLIQASNDC